MSRARDNSHFICYVVISPEAEIVLILVHSITLIPLDMGAYFPYTYRDFEDQIKKNKALLVIYGIAAPFHRIIMSLLNIKFVQKS